MSDFSIELQKFLEVASPTVCKLLNGSIFPEWSQTAAICNPGSFWLRQGSLYSAVTESGTDSPNGVHDPLGVDGSNFWKRVNFSSALLNSDERTMLSELNSLRVASIGAPRYASSTVAPANHIFVNGDFISFAAHPEFKKKYDEGGFEGMVMAWNADAATQSAKRGMFRPDAVVPTGLYAPMDGLAYYQTWVTVTNGTAGEYTAAGLPNVAGEFPYNNSMERGSGALYRKIAQITQDYGIGASSESMLSAVGLDASRSSPIYGNSTTVTPNNIKQPVVIYLGRSDKTLTLSEDNTEWLATNTLRGMGRIASLADAAPNSTITNGPAFLDAATWKISATPAAGIIPLADGNGKLDAWVSQQTQFATCATAAGTAAKEATCSGFSLSTPARVFVTFSNANTVADALTLNVNGTGAKPVYNQYGAASSTNTAMFPANQPIEFVYDGAHWRFYDILADAARGSAPSGRTISLSLPSSGGTIPAPADGDVILSGVANGVNQYVAMACNGPAFTAYGPFPGANPTITLRVKKGANIAVGYNTGGTTTMAFTYSEGAY